MSQSKIRELALRFIDHTIEGDERIYRLKHTPFVYRRSLTGPALAKYGDLPIESRKVVIDNYKGSGYGCNPKYVTQALLDSGEDLDIVWAVKDADAHRQDFPQGVRLVEYHTQEALKEYFTAKVWVSNYHLASYYNIGLVKKPQQTFIQLWHGSLGIKKIEKDCDVLTKIQRWTYLAKKSSADTDYWISNSDFENRVYEQAFWEVKGITKLGHPRNDIFFLDEEKRQVRLAEIRRRLGIEEKQRIFLYVPTFRDEREEEDNVFEGIDYEALKRSLEKAFGGNFCIALRQHPRLRRQMPDYLKKLDILDVSLYPDMQELLLVADVVMTDYSSAIFDFMLSGKPGFILARDYDSYQSLRGLYYPLEETPFPVATSFSELLEKIESFEDAPYQKKIRTFLEDKGCMEDGLAAERVAKLILEKLK